MQRTYQSNKQDRIGFRHTNRYSDVQLRTTKFDKLLMTQASLYPQSKIKVLKTRLPFLSTNSTAYRSETNLHSHGKVGRLVQAINEMQSQLKAMGRDLQDIKNDFVTQSKSLNDKLQHNRDTLNSKVARFGHMIDYCVNENRQRSNRLVEDCQRLKENNLSLSDHLSNLKERMRQLENSMGIYTGEDKHYV